MYSFKVWLNHQDIQEGGLTNALGALAVGGSMLASSPSMSEPIQQPSTQREERTYHHDHIKKMVKADEGVRYKMYDDTKGIKTVGHGHNLESGQSAKRFKEAFGDQSEAIRSHVMSGGKMSEEHVSKLFDADYNHHLERTIKLIPNLHEHPADVQAALVSGVFRGHVTDSPTFRKHFNNGNYQAAANEFLNRSEYRDKGTARGVITRLERDHKIYSDYASKSKQK